MFLFLMWIVFAVLVGVYANTKGRSFAGFTLLSLVLSPLIGLLAALIVKSDRATLESHAVRSGEMKKCPSCAELVRAEATVCRYCSRPFPVAEPIASALTSAPTTPESPAKPNWQLIALIAGMLIAASVAIWMAGPESPLSTAQAGPPTYSDERLRSIIQSAKFDCAEVSNQKLIMSEINAVVIAAQCFKGLEYAVRITSSGQTRVMDCIDYQRVTGFSCP